MFANCETESSFALQFHAMIFKLSNITLIVGSSHSQDDPCVNVIMKKLCDNSATQVTNYEC